ncbi:MAG TPA: polyphosphate polymerase domain-containing protein [Bacteriovoracaceae bacterium]|nr:polyphosphate polymerase domain-containing protein [Bacteriovoracaceae bacterium]
MEKSSPLIFDRYELKYLIPESLIEPISRYISAYCELDPYSLSAPDHFYQVNSLYLDTNRFLFLRRKLDEAPERFNMRIRGYGGPELFLELKFKSNGFVKKRRAFCRGNVMDVLEEYSDEGLGLATGNRHLFMNAFHSYNVEPKVLTQYKRKAYFSNYDDYARITFDKDLRYQATTEFNIIPNPRLMCNYDNETQFREGTNVVLELKCPQRVPLWFIDLIKRFDLTRTGFSKYTSSVMEIMPQFQALRHDRIGAI